MNEVIKSTRSALGLSQAALAKLAGVESRQIRRYEAGESHPTLPVAVRIAKALGISVEMLAGQTADEPDKLVAGICEVVITGPSADWMVEFTKKLVDERLAACGHNLTTIRSIYRWQGEVHDEPEARVMLHTRQSLVPEVIDAAREAHPYDVPCVLSVPISEAHPEYHRWVVAETRDPRLPSKLKQAANFL